VHSNERLSTADCLVYQVQLIEHRA